MNADEHRSSAVKIFFNRQWWWTTLLVLAAIGVMARLGVWQLDRREQRRARNADILQKLASPPLPLTGDGSTEPSSRASGRGLAKVPLPADPAELKNRLATARGKYDLSRQVALTHQHWMNSPGFHLITPLVIEGGARPTAVLVDRGWLPARELTVENWSKYDVTEPVTVTGYIKLSQTFEAEPTRPSAPQTEWYRVDVAAIAGQMPYELLPIYLQQVPPPDGDDRLPYRGELETDLSEGPHLSYAIQWFIFATILGVGYVHYVGKRTDRTVDGRQVMYRER